MSQSSISILYFIKQTIDLYNKYMTRVAEECEISKPEADILLFLANNPEFDTAKDVVEHRGFSKGFVSKAIDMLAERSLISITVDKFDRRYQHIVINKKAEETVKLLQYRQKDYLDKIMNNIDNNDIEKFLNIFKDITENGKIIINSSEYK